MTQIHGKIETTEINSDNQAEVRVLSPAPTVESALRKFAGLPGCLLLESSMQMESSEQEKQPLGRYSFLMADPFDTIVLDNPNRTNTPESKTLDSVFDHLRSALSKYHTQTIPGLPPMQGGIAGLFSYDLNRAIENVNATAHDEFQIPSIVTGIYDTVIAWDHLQNKAWIISQGFPETEPAKRKSRAEARIEEFIALLESEIAPTPQDDSEIQNPPINLSPTFEVDGPDQLKSNFDRDGYINAVQKCIDFIHAGDVFQINLSQRLLLPANCSSLELYQRLRQCNPAPFSAYFDTSKICNVDAQIISASPERLVSVRDRLVETRPIKGTRRRTGQPMVDIQARDALLASGKDRAENTMIVDLMRNDLSRVCTDDSICVTQLCELEQYQSVIHLVSAVQGKLKLECDLTDLLHAVFPGGSITGAPKVRAMEIISELEPTARGAYCGALGYLGFDGNADLNILIRTITASRGWWQIPVGGGIVSQSHPVREYEETWTKAAGMLRATVN